MIEKEDIQKAVFELKKSKKNVALTGAGISVESGIAPFRGNGGLWEKYDPYEYAHLESFMHNPEKSWIMLKEMGRQIFNATPNPAHYSLTNLQKKGKLDTIITQNVDNLHQEAGNTKVIEFHGNYKKLKCLKCGMQYTFEKGQIQDIHPPPQCQCGFILKPNVVLFGETPPLSALNQSEKAVFSCEILLIIGTSAMVYPAANLPIIAKKYGAIIIEINTEPTQLTINLTDIFLQGNAGEILQIIERYL